MVDRQNLPRPAPEPSEDGVPATDEIPEDVLVTGDQLEGERPDDEADAIGDVDPAPEDTLSAEEAAVRVVDEPAGLNYDTDPGYVDRDRSGERGGA